MPGGVRALPCDWFAWDWTLRGRLACPCGKCTSVCQGWLEACKAQHTCLLGAEPQCVSAGAPVRVPFARLPCCETSDTPGSWAPAPPRCPNRCKIPHTHTAVRGEGTDQRQHHRKDREALFHLRPPGTREHTAGNKLRLEGRETASASDSGAGAVRRLCQLTAPPWPGRS